MHYFSIRKRKPDQRKCLLIQTALSCQKFDYSVRNVNDLGRIIDDGKDVRVLLQIQQNFNFRLFVLFQLLFVPERQTSYFLLVHHMRLYYVRLSLIPLVNQDFKNHNRNATWDHIRRLRLLYAEPREKVVRVRVVFAY